MEIIFDRCKASKIIIFTICRLSLSAIPKEINCFKQATKVSRSILSEYYMSMFEDFLYKHGINKYYVITGNKNRILSYYGYFVYNPKNS